MITLEQVKQCHVEFYQFDNDYFRYDGTTDQGVYFDIAVQIKPNVRLEKIESALYLLDNFVCYVYSDGKEIE